jgi:protein lifeguard
VVSKISLLEAYTVGTIVTFYDTTIVLEALLITVGLFAGLTLFTLQSKWDFSGMGPFLFGGLWALVLAGFIMLFFPHNGYPPLHKFANLQNRGGGILGYWSLDILSLYHL